MSVGQSLFNSHFSEFAFPPPSVKGYSFDTTDLPFTCSRVSQGTATTSGLSKRTHMLALPIKSNGFLEVTIASEKACYDTRDAPMVFAPCGAQQNYNFTGKTDNLMLSLDADFVERVGEEWGSGGAQELLDPLPRTKLPRVEHLMRDMQRLMHSADVGWRILTEAAAMQITVELFRYFVGEKKNSSTRITKEIDFERLEEFIDAYIDENLSLTELAVTQDMDVFSFSRVFKTKTGKTPGQFLIERRIARACRLLTDSDMPLAEIAYSCGFSSQAHMTSTFSKHVGTTPGRYRKEARS